MEMFDACHCTEDALVQRCKELMFSKENTELAVELFINKTRHEIIADRLNIDVKSVGIRKVRMKKKLNSRI